MRALDVSRLGKRFAKVSPKTLEALADAALNALGVVVEP
jgi:mRNA-degrading endonuclease toxin of MazEF toxin-antitoxin module